MVKRYDCTSGGAPFCQGCYTMTEDSLGDYVKFEDHDVLSARLAEAEMLLRQCSAVWHDQGPLPAIIAGFLERAADRETGAT